MRGDHSSRSAVTNALKRHTRTAMKKRIIMPFLFGLAPDGVYLARAVTLAAVRSYRTLSALPARTQVVSFLWHCPLAHASRALPGILPFWSPDFPRKL